MGERSTGSGGLTDTCERNLNVKRDNNTIRDLEGYNTWYWKVTEFGELGYRNVVYTNKIGQPLAIVKELINPAADGLKRLHTTATDGQSWKPR